MVPYFQISLILEIALRPTTHVSIIGAGSSHDRLTHGSTVAIRANSRPLSLSFTSKGCCSTSCRCQILFGSHDKPPTHDPNDCAKVSGNTLLKALI
jgi:hypothetical protein